MKKTVPTAILAALCAGTATTSETTLRQTNLAQSLNIDLVSFRTNKGSLTANNAQPNRLLPRTI
jgi:hypothetical protein